MLPSVTQRVRNGHDLTIDEMAEALGRVMEGRSTEDEIAEFLLALRQKGEAVSEVAGAALAMRRHMTVIRSGRDGLLDTCGTGGGGSSTFNISTAAALVAAAAGVPVAKHGNCGITSRSGSADALAALGVNIRASVPQVEACLDQLGICFCFAPLLHSAMRHVAPVRKRLAVPTIFNILGPLCNPAGAAFQLLGVGRGPLLSLMADALALLGIRRAVVVHGSDGLGEVTLSGPTRVVDTSPAASRQFEWSPSDFGLETADLASIRITGPDQSAALIRGVLAGQPGAARDIVIANAAAALWTAGRADTPRQGAAQAAASIDSGAAADLLGRLIQLSHQPA